MKRTTIILLGLFVLITVPAYSVITFMANYDQTTDADYGVGGTQETYQQPLITNGTSGHTGSALQIDNFDSPITEHKVLYQYSGNIGTTGTVEMWIQPNWASIADTESRFLLCTSTGPSPRDDIRIFVSGNAIRAHFIDDDVVTGVLSSGDVIDTGWKNEWHHVAVTFDSGANSSAIYIDGILKDSGSFTLPNSAATDIAVGYYIHDLGYSNSRFDGKIDELIIHDDVKTDFANRNEPKYIKGPDPIFMAHYDLLTNGDYSRDGSILEYSQNCAQIYTEDMETEGKFQQSYHSTKLSWGPRILYWTDWSIDHDPDFTATGTVSFWFKPDWSDNTDTTNYLFNASRLTTPNGALTLDRMLVYSADNRIIANFWNDNYTAGSPFPQLIGIVAATVITPTWKDEWHHIAVTYDSDNWTAALYIDGVEMNTMDMSASHPAYSMLDDGIDVMGVGYNMWVSDGYWAHAEGKIDELCIYDEVRTEFTDRYVPSMRDNRDDTLPIFVAHFDNGLNADTSAGATAPTQADTVAITTGGQGWDGEAVVIGDTTSSSVLLYDGANINMAAGTVEMWVKTDNWSSDYFDTDGANYLFSAMDPDTPINALTLHIQRYTNSGGGHWADARFLSFSDWWDSPTITGQSGYATTFNGFGGSENPWRQALGHVNDPYWNQKWHHLAITWEADNYLADPTAGTMKLYLEGQLTMQWDSWQGSILPNVTSFADFALGCQRNNLAGQFKGFIDEVRIYDYAKTQFLDRYSVYPLYGVTEPSAPNVTITLVSGNIVLNWGGETGATYQAYYTDNELNAPPTWTALGTQKTGAGTHTVTDSAIAATSKRFYKVVVSN